MMSCLEANPFLEAVAVGETVPDQVRAHVDDCATCKARLQLAERIGSHVGRQACGSTT